MQDHFTKNAKDALSLAAKAAKRLGHSYIGSEHILLGLLEEKQGHCSCQCLAVQAWSGKKQNS